MSAKTAVITGSTRGIGAGMAKAFLERGWNVVINGRSAASVEQAAASLSTVNPDAVVLGVPGDVSDYAQVENLWAQAAGRFGKVDLWINNAGLSHAPTPFWEMPPEQMETIVRANITGTMYGTRMAIRGMLAQGGGALYNMEGLGSSGRQRVSGLSIYASTKAALRFFDQAIAQELAGTPVLFGTLSPGMVLTDMLLNRQVQEGPDWERTKRVFNILADRTETVAPWLVEQMIANREHGRRIRWLTGSKIAWRFLSSPFVKRDLFTDLP